MKPLLAILLFLSLSANAQQKFTVYFNFNNAKATNASNEKLLQWIDNNKDAKIEKIYGYADKSGNETYNQDLSERRALYVYKQLKSADIMLENVEEKSFGESLSSRISKTDRKVEIYYNKNIYKVSLKAEPSVTNLTRLFKEAKVGDKIVLKDIYFAGGTTYILKESRQTLKELYKIMNDNPKLKIDLQGHICCDKDDIGDLSGKRAMEIYLYLNGSGIDGKRMQAHGFGGHKPIHRIPEWNNEEKAENRRVEVEILEK